MCMIQIDQMAPFRPPNYFSRIFHSSSISVNQIGYRFSMRMNYTVNQPNNFTNNIKSLRSNSNGLQRIKRNKIGLSTLSKGLCEKVYDYKILSYDFNTAVVVPLPPVFVVRMTTKMNRWRTLAHFHFICLHQQHR